MKYKATFNQGEEVVDVRADGFFVTDNGDLVFWRMDANGYQRAIGASATGAWTTVYSADADA